MPFLLKSDHSAMILKKPFHRNMESFKSIFWTLANFMADVTTPSKYNDHENTS